MTRPASRSAPQPRSAPQHRPGRIAGLPLLALLVLALAACGPGVSASGGGSGDSGGTAFTPDPRHDRMADSLVHELIEAAGGMQRFWEMETARFILTTEWWDVDEPRIRRTRPRYITIDRRDSTERGRLERWEGDNLILQGFDGDTAWATMNGELLEPGQMDRDQVEYVASDVNYWIGLPYKLRDPGLTLHYDGVDEQGRHDVRVTFEPGIGEYQDVWHYYFEAGEPWPVEITYQEDGSTNVNRTRWEDIQTVDGYTFVGRRVSLNADGMVRLVVATSNFEFNPALEAGVFSSP